MDPARIGQVLADYFAWSRTNSPGSLGYPGIDPVRRLLGTDNKGAGLTDLEAIYVDRGLQFLKEENGAAYLIILRYYRDGHTLRWMQAHGHGDRRTNARILAEGEQFIRGALFGVQLSEYIAQNG